MEKQTLYGQHSRATLIGIAIACVVAGLLFGLFAIPPDALPFHQRIGVGLATGFWAGFCLYGWRVLFSESENED